MSFGIRLGIVGAGNSATQYIRYILRGDLNRCTITALCSRHPSTLAIDHDLRHFTDYRALIDSGCCDALLVASPTYTHHEIGIYALQRGLHVLMEKPLGLSVLEGEQMLDAANGQCFALMLNQRADPRFQVMKTMIDEGDLGRIRRCHWTMTNWFRPDIYFQTSEWCGTWVGEGGGLLMNQCIHNLDIFQWLCGMPAQVRAHCSFGKYHDIEVEDEVSAYFDYGSGASGVFIGSTGEAPGVNRFDVVGDRGTLTFDGHRVLLTVNSPTTAEYCRETLDMFGMPDSQCADITPNDEVNQHVAILKNFICAILDGDPLIAPAEEGLGSLAIANSILLSEWTRSTVELPLDGMAYQLQLEQRIKHSGLRQKTRRRAHIDMDKSYR